MHIFNVTLDGEELPINLLVAQFSSEQSIESALEQIYNGFERLRLRASGLVLRPDVRDQFTMDAITSACAGNAPPDSTFLNALAVASVDPGQHWGRLADLPIFVLYADSCVLRLGPNVNPLVTPTELVQAHIAHPETVAKIRVAEMRFLVDNSRALLLPVEGSYYEPPSRRPSRSFLRVGNIQYSRQAVDAVTFWLLPSLRQCDAILVDTWSLSSIAFNASRVLASIRGEKPVPVEMLSQYQDSSEERQANLMEVLDRLAADGGSGTGDDLRVTCIVSATHSGSLVAILKDQVDLSSLGIELEFVTLFQLGNTAGLPALCNLSNDAEFAPFNDDDLNRRTAIQIDPQIYFPLRYIDVPHIPLESDARKFRPFLDLVRGNKILSAHRDQSTDGPTRHHALHVDMERLFALPQFNEKLRQSLSELDPAPALVLTPQHPAARLLGDITCDIIQSLRGFRPQRLEHTSLHFRPDGPRREADQNVKNALTAAPPASSILVLDDCFVTGARMTAYQTRLRKIAVPARIHYLVGLARPDHPKTWHNFRRMLRFRLAADRQDFPTNTVSAVFEACLPNWQEGRCPWCEETLLYQVLQKDGQSLPDEILTRQTLLADRDTGLRDNLFLAEPDGAESKLYSGSIFGTEDSNQAEVFAAVAAALQHLRVSPNGDRPVLGPRRYPVATVLEAEHYLHRTYTDTVLRASLLRGTISEELVYTDVELEAKRTKLITNILVSSDIDVNNLSLELVLAQAMRKCQISEEIDRSALPANASRLLGLFRSQNGK